MDVQQFISSTTKYSKQITEINSMIRRVTINNKLTIEQKQKEFYILKKDFCDLREYVDSIIKICKSENVSFLLTLIDPELELLSQYRNYFKENNITLIISDPNIIETTTDKYLFYVTYRNKLKVLKTYKDESIEIVKDIIKKTKEKNGTY